MRAAAAAAEALKEALLSRLISCSRHRVNTLSENNSVDVEAPEQSDSLFAFGGAKAKIRSSTRVSSTEALSENPCTRSVRPVLHVDTRQSRPAMDARYST